MDPISEPTEVIILFNIPEGAHPDRRALHDVSIRQAETFKSSQTPPKNLTLHLVSLDDLPKKHFGAGLARKLVMDEATRRFNMINNPGGIILSLDADTLVEPNYVAAVSKLFTEHPTTEGCSIHFEHPLDNRAIPRKENFTKPHEDPIATPPTGDPEVETGQAYTGEDKGRGGDTYSEAVYQAITNYELHQRYYLMATRYTGYPYAYHTVGSAFAVRARAYARYGGMSRRQAGEDFYFIQKVAVNGRFGECNTTTVYPSPRTSDRVPFGTGPDIARQLKYPDGTYLTFNPELFYILRGFYFRANAMYAKGEAAVSAFENELHPLLVMYLKRNNYRDTLGEIFDNVASEQAFRQRFFRNFNWLWLLKFLHYGEQNGIGKVPLEEALQQLLKQLQISYPSSGSLKNLLLHLRRMQKSLL